MSCIILKIDDLAGLVRPDQLVIVCAADYWCLDPGLFERISFHLFRWKVKNFITIVLSWNLHFWDWIFGKDDQIWNQMYRLNIPLHQFIVYHLMQRINKNRFLTYSAKNSRGAGNLPDNRQCRLILNLIYFR